MTLQKVRSAVLMLAVCAAASSFGSATEEKIQKITFVEDDAQKKMASKIYTLKHTKAADILPFVRSAVKRYCEDSQASAIADRANKRQLVIVSTGVDMIEYTDKLIAALDRKSAVVNDSNIFGTGIAYGTYQPTFRSAESMKEVLVEAGVAGDAEDGRLKLDIKRNMFYFKDSPYYVKDIRAKLGWLDKPVPQSRIRLAVYEVRDSDLKDIGIDYLAWKNGPGLNLFSASYNALNLRAADMIFNELAGLGVDVLGNISWGFGGFYTAPAFDLSFLRILQQNGKATISSTATILVSNAPGRTFSVEFAPEYQNIVKDENHTTSVAAGSDSSLKLDITQATVTSGKDAGINFSYLLTDSNVTERNNLGSEITEQVCFSGAVTLPFNRESVLAAWNKAAKVEQTVGIPFLSEIPVLKYLFGTTTQNSENIRCIVTAEVIPTVYNENIAPGTASEFEDALRSK